MRLFVDCDDTLVLWDDTHQNQDKTLWIRDSWQPNTQLIAAVKSYADNVQPDLVIIWSGGGLEYARGWLERLFPDERGWVAASKDTTLPESGDLCVDDMEIVTKGLLVSPSKFVELCA